MLRIVRHLTMRKGLLFGGIIGLVLVAGALALLFSWRANAPTPPKQQAVVKPTPVVSSADTKLLVMGDIYWGRYMNDWSMASPLEYSYPFQSLGEFNRDDYDAWIANMECPITNNPKVSSAQEEATLTFDCSPEYLSQAKQWFTAVSLGNNHTGNQNGEVGQAETRVHLAENDIQSFGSYDPEDVDNICNIISIPVHVVMSDSSSSIGMLPIAWCGYDGVFATPSATSLATVEKYAQHFTVVAMPHSGLEYQPAPDAIKTTFYRGLIDNGADVVIGNHAHWVQTSEAYKGHLILYSLGNFIFDQQFSSEVTRSAVLSISASITALDAPDLDKWLALGSQCKTYNDTCLQQATDQKLQKLPLQLHFSILGSVDAGKVTHRANDEQVNAIKQRLQWAQTIGGLSGQYSGE